MQRTPEPELMDQPAQALAYARGDFEAAHQAGVRHYLDRFGATPRQGRVLDLGCGPGDVTRRFAYALPGCRFDAVDGAAAMLELARHDTRDPDLVRRIHWRRAHLPADPLPGTGYAAVISNSLLHHLADPMDLWHSLARVALPGAPLWVMDLLRPSSAAAVDALVAQYAATATPILREDFRASLHAAYRPDEVATQLRAADLGLRVEVVSDRHWIAHGRA